MSTLVVFVAVFGLAGAFFVWLKRLGRRMGPQNGAGADAADGGDALAENLTFAAEMAEKIGRRRAGRSGDGAAPDSDGDGGGGDGGGDGGG